MRTKVKDTVVKPTIIWPESIDLHERFPEDHLQAGQLRYRLTRGGVGRIDMDTYREVPQQLVDQAIAAENAAIAKATAVA
jgi:hypothetical protein